MSQINSFTSSGALFPLEVGNDFGVGFYIQPSVFVTAWHVLEEDSDLVIGRTVAIKICYGGSLQNHEGSVVLGSPTEKHDYVAVHTNMASENALPIPMYCGRIARSSIDRYFILTQEIENYPNNAYWTFQRTQIAVSTESSVDGNGADKSFFQIEWDGSNARGVSGSPVLGYDDQTEQWYIVGLVTKGYWKKWFLGKERFYRLGVLDIKVVYNALLEEGLSDESP